MRTVLPRVEWPGGRELAEDRRLGQPARRRPCRRRAERIDARCLRRRGRRLGRSEHPLQPPRRDQLHASPRRTHHDPRRRDRPRANPPVAPPIQPAPDAERQHDDRQWQRGGEGERQQIGRHGSALSAVLLPDADQDQLDRGANEHRRGRSDGCGSGHRHLDWSVGSGDGGSLDRPACRAPTQSRRPFEEQMASRTNQELRRGGARGSRAPIALSRGHVREVRRPG